jgi:hypothetical protein
MYCCTEPKPTGVTSELYLSTIFGIVNHFTQFQNTNSSSPLYGKIIDPYAQQEIQYSTPCYANAGAMLIKTVQLSSCSDMHASREQHLVFGFFYILFDF